MKRTFSLVFARLVEADMPWMLVAIFALVEDAESFVRNDDTEGAYEYKIR